MSGIPLLDWAGIAVSLFDTMLLTWLGVMIWLTSERRTRGIYLTTAGLLLGASFFICHSIILAQSRTVNNPWLDIWWRAGWMPVVVSPFVWYLVVLWYAGFWEGQTSLRKRQQPFLYLTGAVGTILTGFLVFGHPLPAFFEAASLDLASSLAPGGIYLLVFLLPANILGCVLLSLDALLRPGPVRRPMGDQARIRARPWLLISSLILLVVSLLVGAALFEIVAVARTHSTNPQPGRFFTTLASFDLVIAGLIGMAVLFLGQALVSYEIFTGKTLPRQGLQRYFHSAVILSASLSAAAAITLTPQIFPIYGLLSSLLIAVVFFALFTWLSFLERERTIGQLRPFVNSQHLYDLALHQHPGGVDEVEWTAPFQALVEGVLDARQGALAALGSMEALVTEPMFYPTGFRAKLDFLADLHLLLLSPEKMAIPLAAEQCEGFAWAVSLWSERGLIGVLLLGEKKGRSFYTQEEIEIARASGERLVDTRVSIEMMRRLAALQRDRMVATQVVDRQTRRVLHDEILPAMHTSMLMLSSAKGSDDPGKTEAMKIISAAHRQVSALLQELPPPPAPEVTRLGLLGALRHMVDQGHASAFDKVDWVEDDKAGEATAALPALTTEVIYYAAREAVRNAARHARTDRPLHLRVTVEGGKGFKLVIEDNGTGMQPGQARDRMGAGEGLALHSTLMAVVGGALLVESQAGKFTRITLQV